MATTVTPWQVVSWLLKHSGDAPKIMADAQSIMAAPDLPSKWTATKALGDLIVPDLGDFPTGGAVMTPAKAGDAETKLMALMPDGAINPANFQAILAFLASLLQIFFPAKSEA